MLTTIKPSSISNLIEALSAKYYATQGPNNSLNFQTHQDAIQCLTECRSLLLRSNYRVFLGAGAVSQTIIFSKR